MFGIAVATIVLGYAMMYTALENVTHAGDGHTLFQNLGITTTVSLGDPVNPNLTGQPPTTPGNPLPGGTVNI